MTAARDRLRVVGCLLATAFRVNPRLTLLAFAVGPAAQLAGPLQALWIKQIVDTPTGGPRDVLVPVSLFAVTVTTLHVIETAGEKMRISLEEQTSLELETRLFDVLDRPVTIAHYQSPAVLNEIQTLREHHQLLGKAVGSLILTLGVAVQLVSVAGLLSSISPLLGLLPACAVPAVLSTGRAQFLEIQADRRVAEQRRLAHDLFRIGTVPAYGKEVRTRNLSAWLQRHHDEALARAYQERMAAQLRGTVLSTAGWLVFAAVFFGTLVHTGFRAARGEATAGDVVLLALLGGQLEGTVSSAVQLVKHAARLLAIASGQGALETRVAGDEAPGTHAPPSHLQSGVRVRDLSYRYPGAAFDSVQRASFDLAPGAVIAIVGENGAGKTTLIRLLCGLYRPSAGTIHVDSLALGDGLDRRGWQRSIGGEFQDYYRFELTVSQNLALGDPTANEDALWAALDKAGARTIVEAFPAGLRTQLGTSFGGVQPSDGQWQRLALARGLVRPNPLLVVLDEPAANLDPEAEQRLIMGMRELAARGRDTGTITVFVSHRLWTARLADLVIVVSNGRVEEVGRHDELIAQRGAYSELFALQRRDYE